MKYCLGILLLIINSASCVLGQQKETGLPSIDNFTPKQYNAYTQNWAAVQDQRGVMYFGNNKGVLEYDGVNWRTIPVSNNSIASSLAIDSAGTIFVGAVGEFGYLAPDKAGSLQYHSLVENSDESEPAFSDVWSTLVKGDEVYFHTVNFLFRYKDGEIKSWPLKNSYHRSFIVYDKLYLRQDEKGLMVLNGDSLTEVEGGDIFSKEIISAMMPFQNKILIGSRSRGLFLYDPKLNTINTFPTKANKFLSENLLYHGVLLANGNYAFATIKKGIIITDKETENPISLTQNTNLLQNTVFYLYADKQGALWAALSKGISKIDISSPINVYDDILGIDGSIIAITRHQDILYVATHLGVFYLKPTGHFEKVKGLDKQCWGFEKFAIPSVTGKQKLLVASTEGIFEVEGARIKLVAETEGPVFHLKASRSDPSRVYIGFDGSLGSMRYEKGQWVQEGQFKIVNDAFRSIQEDNAGNLWMGTMFAGAYHLKVKDWEDYITGKNLSIQNTINKYGVSSGLPTLNWNCFFRINEELVVATQKGAYRFNALKNNFEKHVEINNAINYPDRWLYYLIEDEKGNIWFDSDKGKGFLLKKDQRYILSDAPLKRISVSSENEVSGYADKDGQFLFGTPDGLFRYDTKLNKDKDYTQPFHVLIRSVTVGADSVVFNGSYFKNSEVNKRIKSIPSFIQPASLKNKLQYTDNSLSFHFAAPAYEGENTNKFSHFLEGYDKSWSAWSKVTMKEYTNLPEGTYTFKVKAKNLFNTESEESIYEFTILPPWYRTPLAYFAFVSLFTGVLFLSAKAYSNRLRKGNLLLEAIVQTRTAEINLQKEKIEKQKDEVEKSYTNVKTLSQIGQRITATLDLESIINILYYNLITLMDFSYLGIGTYNESTQSIDFNHAFEDGEAMTPFSFKLTAEDVMSVWSFKNRKEVFINNIEEEYTEYLPLSPTLSPGSNGFCKSIICVPLLIKEKILGVITVKSPWKDAYRSYHLDILRTLATYTAIAIDNSSAYHRLNEINEELYCTLENLKKTQSQLVQSEKMASLGQLTAGVAHEINNPINFVSAGITSLTANFQDLSELLQKFTQLKADAENPELLLEFDKIKKRIDLEYLLEEIPQLLNSINTGAQRTTEIVKSLRNFTRLDEDDLKSADIHQGIDSTLVILRNQITDRIEVIKNYGHIPPVLCYPGRLNQVFMNILNNAIQAIEGEGKVYIQTLIEDNTIKVTIGDNGKGMSEEVRKRIFEPFYTTKEVGEGTGLGLSISYSIIKKHKGKIEVESTPGKGTEFIIYLPLNQN
jgi:signal transduction histidine kinase/ligand-binding sensor domain-containing protein